MKVSKYAVHKFILQIIVITFNALLTVVVRKLFFFSGCLNMSHAGCKSRHIASHNFSGKGNFGGQRRKFAAAAYVTMHTVKSRLLKMVLVRFLGVARTDFGKKAAPRACG